MRRLVRYHLLRANLPIALDVPKSESTCGRRDCLCKAEIGILQEREGKLVILANRHQCAGGVQALSNRPTMSASPSHTENDFHGHRQGGRTRRGR